MAQDIHYLLLPSLGWQRKEQPTVLFTVNYKLWHRTLSIVLHGPSQLPFFRMAKITSCAILLSLLNVFVPFLPKQPGFRWAESIRFSMEWWVQAGYFSIRKKSSNTSLYRCSNWHGIQVILYVCAIIARSQNLRPSWNKNSWCTQDKGVSKKTWF